MPMNRGDYHSQWPEISRQIREQANQECEFCGRKNGSFGFWDNLGEWVSFETLTLAIANGNDVTPPEKFVKTVLTVAHLDHNTRNNDPANLRALCQRCHLRWDATHHAETRRKNKANASGQLTLEVLE